MVSVRSAWKRCKPVEPSGKNADVQERFLDFVRNDDTGIRIVKHGGGQPLPLRGTSFQRKEGESRTPFLWKGMPEGQGVGAHV